MTIRLLGPVCVTDADGHELLPAGVRVRGLLARLALDAGRPVDVATLVAALWDDPPTTANALQSLVSRLRRALGPERVRASSGGYRLDVETGDVDALRFAALRRAAAAETDGARARALLTEALGLWQGPVLGGVRDLPFAEPAAARLSDGRAAVAEDLATRGRAGGDPGAGLDTLVAILDEHPLRETAAVALARGLHAGGRRADALEVLDRTRAALADGLGVDPGPELRRARSELLHDPPGDAAQRSSTIDTGDAAQRSSTIDTGDAAQPSSNGGRPSNHCRPPAALTSFVGRADDLARLGELAGTSRLVTVTGPGGAGKTRLALEALRERPEPVALAELAALTGADQVAPTVLHAVGGPELALGERTTPDTLARIRAALAGRGLVLVLDNCEHLLDAAAALVHELLTSTPGLVVLATSREPLGVPGEVLHPLGALDDEHATRLFVERATAVRPDFVLDGHDVAVAEICRRLDGQPLPIELAAARVRSLEPGEIAERLADRFRLLTTGARTALPRHQTLRAVVDWSWDLLTEDERGLANAFGVFAGAVEVRAVEAVCGDRAFDLLEPLVGKSLIVALPGAGGRPTRYRMLETIREYAAARLAVATERDAVIDSHAEWTLSVLEPGKPRLRTAEQLDELDVVREVEGEAIRALERAVDDGRAAHAHRLLAALTWSWIVRGDMPTLMHWSERVGELGAPAPTMAVAVNRSIRAVLRATQADTSGRRAESAALDAMLPALPWPRHPVVALHPATARAFHDDDRSDLLALADGDGDPWLRAAAAQLAAMHAENSGDRETQRRSLRAAHHGFSRVGDRFGLGLTTFSLGELEDTAGDRPAARRAYLEAASLSEELRKVDDLPQYRMQLAVLAARDGDAEEARAELRLAEEAVHESNDVGVAVWLAWGRADVERRLGDPDAALRHLSGPELPTVDEPGPGREQRTAMLHLLTAAALIDLGRFAEARDELGPAARAAQDSDDGPVLGMVAEASARWALAVGDPARAGELLGVAQDRRGTMHLGDPDVVATRNGVVAALGREAAEAAIERGRAGPRSTPPAP